MTRWPVIRHIRYVWLSWRLRSIAGTVLTDAQLALLDDVWKGRA